MPRLLKNHKVNVCNSNIDVSVRDQPGAGNACHEYVVVVHHDDGDQDIRINFQNGPIAEFGTNGLTHEALLAIIEDRLLCFQAGPYACRENAVALTKIQEAMMWLNKRTADRVDRGVEGTSVI